MIYLINELIQELSALSGVTAIALGGSRSGTHYEESSDYDLYVYYTQPIDNAKRKDLLERYCKTLEFGNSFWEYGDNGLLKNGVEIDIIYRHLNDFTKDIERVVFSHEARNGYTTCMWHNLQTCSVLIDKDGQLTALKERCAIPYPEALKQNIINRNLQLLHGTLSAYDNQLSKAVRRHDIISMNHRTTAFLESYFDIIFALNEQTHPGEKRLIELCKAQCKLLPNHFEENLVTLLNDLYTHSEQTLSHLKRIREELMLLLEKEGALNKSY